MFAKNFFNSPSNSGRSDMLSEFITEGVSKAMLNVYICKKREKFTIVLTSFLPLLIFGRGGIKGGEGKKIFIKIHSL